MSINAQSGAITWTPTVDQAGPNSVVLVVADSSGDSATQSFTVNVNTVAAAQMPPVILSTPSTIALLGQVYAYNAQGADPQNEALAWSLDSAPAGMSINAATGTIRWTPGTTQLGSQNVVVRLTDAEGASVDTELYAPSRDQRRSSADHVDASDHRHRHAVVRLSGRGHDRHRPAAGLLAPGSGEYSAAQRHDDRFPHRADPLDAV